MAQSTCLILGTKTLIILSSEEAVKELVDRRSAISGDHQDVYIGQTLCSYGLRVLMMVRANEQSVTGILTFMIWVNMANDKMTRGLLNVQAARSCVFLSHA